MSNIQTGCSVIEMTMAHLLPSKFDGLLARVLLAAIGMQESGFATRAQRGGPARSFWQFEQGGGIHGVLTNSATSLYAKSFCFIRAVAPVESDVYAAFLTDDMLACAFARLLLFSDPAPLPALGDVETGWNYYQRNWRPGKPRPADWPSNYAAARAAFGVSA
jgi:hypothetical protein